MDKENQYAQRTINYTELLNITTEIGFQLLRNGAEIYRVEDSIRRIFTAYGVDGSDVFTIPLCIMVTINDEHGLPITRIKRLTATAIHVDRIRQLNSLCRFICRETPELNEIREEMAKIGTKREYNFAVQIIAAAFVSFSFTLFYGGGLPEAAIAFFCGFAMKSAYYGMQKFGANSFFINIICSAITTIIALLAVKFGLVHQYDKIIIGTLMNLVPGIVITNVMRDIISGDLLSGIVKFTEALLVGVGIALGAGLSITVFRALALA